jgi:hypothetical protein
MKFIPHLAMLTGALAGIMLARYLTDLRHEAEKYTERTHKPATMWDAAWNDLSKKGKRNW